MSGDTMTHLQKSDQLQQVAAVLEFEANKLKSLNCIPASIWRLEQIINRVKTEAAIAHDAAFREVAA